MLRRPLRLVVVSAAAVVLGGLLACSGGDSPTGTDTDPPAQNQAPSATIVSPAQDASFTEGDMVDFEGSGSDAEDGTLPGSSLEWSSDVDGQLGTGTSLGRDDLSVGGHTITLTATDADGATGTDQVQITVGEAPNAGLVPFQEGRVWRYVEDSRRDWCAWSTGCDSETFVGRHFVRVDAEGSYMGRTAWPVTVYSFWDDAPGDEWVFDARQLYLSQDGSGLSRWHTSGGGEWRRVLSTSSSSITNGTFFLVNGPLYDPDKRLTFSASSATVPYGSFSTVRAVHDYSETGQYATVDIFSDGAEHYADQVGMVRGWWDFSYDPNDPQAMDVWGVGEIELTHMDSGPFPDFVAEAEPNDDHGAADAVSGFSISAAEVRDGDPGVVLTDAEVGCTIQVCIHEDVNGVKVVQDWFRFDLSQQTAIRIELDFPTYDFDFGVYNDLDLYLFGPNGSGGLLYLAKSVAQPGNREVLAGTANAGTYYLGVQAYDTPAGEIPYWLAIF